MSEMDDRRVIGYQSQRAWQIGAAFEAAPALLDGDDAIGPRQPEGHRILREAHRPVREDRNPVVLEGALGEDRAMASLLGCAVVPPLVVAQDRIDAKRRAEPCCL